MNARHSPTHRCKDHAYVLRALLVAVASTVLITPVPVSLAQTMAETRQCGRGTPGFASKALHPDGGGSGEAFGQGASTIQFNRTPTKGINHAVMLITVTALLLVSVPAYAEMRLTSKDLTAGDLSGQTVAVVVAFE